RDGPAENNRDLCRPWSDPTFIHRAEASGPSRNDSLDRHYKQLPMTYHWQQAGGVRRPTVQRRVQPRETLLQLALRLLAATTDLLGDTFKELASLALHAPDLFLDGLNSSDQEANSLTQDHGDRSSIASDESDSDSGDMCKDACIMVCCRDALDG